MTTSMINDIAVAVNDHLLSVMKTLIATADPTRAGVVRTGLLQDDPTNTPSGVNVLTHLNDPEDDKGWRHTLADAGNQGGFHIPSYEIGGSQRWYRRYTTQLTQFFHSNVTRNKAREYASIILARAESEILQAPLPQGIDSFGEVALFLIVNSSINIEAGGDTEFIYNGMIWWQCLTERNF